MAISLGSLAFTVALSVASYLLRPKMPDQHSEGPRLSDLSATGSSYGGGIARVWGTYPVSGNVIWMGPVNEHKNTQSERVGGKGGGGQKVSQTTYTYSVSFAVGLARGPIRRVVKILMDNQVVFDATGANVQMEVQGLRWRFYPGSETQLPDSIIEAHEGAGNTPAHRGLSYVVFDELPITPFANRIPQLQFVVQSEGEGTCIQENFEQVESSFTVDFRLRQKNVFWQSREGYWGLESYHIDTRQLIRRRELPAYTGGVLDAGDSGDFLVWRWIIPAGGSWSRRNLLSVIDASTLTEKATGLANRFLHTPESGALASYVGHIDGSPRTIAAIGCFTRNMGATVSSPTWIMDLKGGGVLYDSRTPSGALDGRSVCSYFARGARRDGQAEFFWLRSREMSGLLDTSMLDLVRIVIRDVMSMSPLGAPEVAPEIVSEQTLASISRLDLDPVGRIDGLYPGSPGYLGPSWCPVDDIIYDESDGGVIVTACQQAFALKYSASGVKLWQFNSDPDWQRRSITDVIGEVFDRGSRTVGGTYALRGRKNNKFVTYTLDTRTGDVLAACDKSTPALLGAAYDSLNRSLVGQMAVIHLSRFTGGEVSVATIISDISNEVDQPHNDFTEIAPYTVLGFAHAKPMSARSLIEPLGTLYNFDAVDAGGYLRWIRRGKDSVQTFEPGEMVQVGRETGAVIESTRAQELSLPQSVAITYSEPSTNYEPATFYRQRFKGNEGYDTTRSRNQYNLEVPAAILADIAKQSADIILMGQWNGRTSHKLRLARPALLLDPGDAITIALPGEFPEDVRIDRNTVGADLQVELDTTGQDSSQYVSVVEAEVGAGFIPQIIVPEMVTRLYLLPLPYLQDLNDQGRSRLIVYYAMGAYMDGWKNGALDYRAGNGSFSPIGGAPFSTPHGVLVEDLPPANPDDVYCTNETLRLRVSMIHGELESTSLEEIQNGHNALAIVRSPDVAEIIQFREAVLEEDGDYTLTGIVRGQRGTDSWALSGSSPSGTLVVLLGPDLTQATTLPLDRLGLVEAYRGYGGNQSPENGDTQSIKVAGNELKPWAPVHLKVAGISDLTLTWERRTRLRGALRDGTSLVPVEEDTERFEVDVLDGNTLLRTIVVDGTTTAIYTTAQQVEDGLTGAATFIVHQISAQVGRGFASLPAFSGPMAVVGQASAWMIERVPKPDAMVAAASAFAIVPGDPFIDVAQTMALAITRPDANIDNAQLYAGILVLEPGVRTIAQTSAISIIQGNSRWALAQAGIFVIQKE